MPLKYIACYVSEVSDTMERHTGFLIKQLYFLHQQRLNKIFSEFDLTATQTFTLLFLFRSHEKGISVNQKDIEHEMDISNPTVTGNLNRLEHKGLIERKACHHDARAKNIVVTDKALELDKLLRNKFREADEELVAPLSEDEKDILHDLMVRMLKQSI